MHPSKNKNKNKNFKKNFIIHKLTYARPATAHTGQPTLATKSGKKGKKKKQKKKEKREREKGTQHTNPLEYKPACIHTSSHR